jgi:AmmeMemoRadiSam system protein B/AmmeMemoRadiSam system protein A
LFSRIHVPLLLLLLLPITSPAQETVVDRQPAVAGQFYPAKADELKQMLASMFARAVPPGKAKNVAAIIVPHAGYIYSGEVAASGFHQIDASKAYDNIFIIGPSHHVGFEGASVYTEGNFITPLGTVEVNRELGKKLIKECAMFSDRTDAHAEEHSVEVQVPFLQYIMKKHFRIVPIVVGANSQETCRKLADALRPYLNDRNLFVISSDFSHYPGYDDAVRADSNTAAAILSNSPTNLVQAMQRNEEARMPNLVTSLCGWSGVLTFLDMTTADAALRFTKVQYRNSGDSPAGDRSRVVGYCAIAVSRAVKQERTAKFELLERDKSLLLSMARQAVEAVVERKDPPPVDPGTLSEALRAPCGAFVTLNKNHALRGCIGRFDATEPLYKVVRMMAVAAATQDPRFSPVESAEIPDLEIEISVLTPMRRIHSIDEFELGRQGIYMKSGNRSGTFLPQVAGETGWTKEEFFGHCSQDKAGMGWDGWKSAELYVYEALVFGEK